MENIFNKIKKYSALGIVSGIFLLGFYIFNRWIFEWLSVSGTKWMWQIGGFLIILSPINFFIIHFFQKK